MEIHDSQVNGFKEQNPQEYAAYTQNLRAYKATKHAVVYARLDNAPEVSTGEKDFLRALPDSIDIVTMRNADRLPQSLPNRGQARQMSLNALPQQQK